MWGRSTHPRGCLFCLRLPCNRRFDPATGTAAEALLLLLFICCPSRPIAPYPPLPRQVTDAFLHYKAVCAAEVWPAHDAAEHWAKVEPPPRPGPAPPGPGVPGAAEAEAEAEARHARALAAARAQLRGRFPTKALAAARARLDPRGVLANKLVDALLPR